MKKELPYVIFVLLVLVALFFLMQVNVTCEDNPKMVMNGYCNTGDNK